MTQLPDNYNWQSRKSKSDLLLAEKASLAKSDIHISDNCSAQNVATGNSSMPLIHKSLQKQLQEGNSVAKTSFSTDVGKTIHKWTLKFEGDVTKFAFPSLRYLEDVDNRDDLFNDNRQKKNANESTEGSKKSHGQYFTDIESLGTSKYEPRWHLDVISKHEQRESRYIRKKVRKKDSRFRHRSMSYQRRRESHIKIAQGEDFLKSRIASAVQSGLRRPLHKSITIDLGDAVDVVTEEEKRPHSSDKEAISLGPRRLTQEDEVEIYHGLSRTCSTNDEVWSKTNERTRIPDKDEAKLPRSMQYLEQAILWYRSNHESIEREEECQSSAIGAEQHASQKMPWGYLRDALKCQKLKALAEVDGTSELPLTTETGARLKKHFFEKVQKFSKNLNKGFGDDDHGPEERYVAACFNAHSPMIPEPLMIRDRRTEATMRSRCLAKAEYSDVLLPQFGIGDARCRAIADSLQLTDSVKNVDLTDNRLTVDSIVPLLRGLVRSQKKLARLRIGFNDMSNPSCKPELERLFAMTPMLVEVDMQSCQLEDSHATVIATSLAIYYCTVKRLNLSRNRIGGFDSDVNSACVAIADLLRTPGCSLTFLELSWNQIKDSGTKEIGAALCGNISLKELKLSYNAIGDEGAHQLAGCFMTNVTLETLTLEYNHVGYKTCFVFAQVLSDTERRREFDPALGGKGYMDAKLGKRGGLTFLSMNGNDLGEAGARALFRLILGGLTTYISMQNCTFPDDCAQNFVPTRPEMWSPYTLDLSRIHDVALLHEICAVLRTNQGKVFKVSHATFSLSRNKGARSSPLGDHQSGNPLENIIIDVQKHYQFKKEVGMKGILNFSVVPISPLKRPTVKDRLTPGGFFVFCLILLNARSHMDRANWLRLIAKDIHVDTSQVQALIDKLTSKDAVGLGAEGFDPMDAVLHLWTRIIDHEAKFEFLHHNFDEEERKHIAHVLTTELFNFNFNNATWHWRLDLLNSAHRGVLDLITSLHASECAANEQSNRGDTSQHGNWCNFRNETLDGQEIVIDKEKLEELRRKRSGVLEFDYVSTTRPPKSIFGPKTKSGYSVESITKCEFQYMCDQIGINLRLRSVRLHVMFLVELQQAASQHFFSTTDLLAILDCFDAEKHNEEVVGVVVALFSRIIDLHSLGDVLFYLPHVVSQEIIKRLGYLNVINPLALEMHFDCRLHKMDHLRFVKTLMDINEEEQKHSVVAPLSAERRSTVTIADLYEMGGYLKVESVEHTMDKVVHLCFRAPSVDYEPWWEAREMFMRRFLCSDNVTDDMLAAKNKFREMVKAGHKWKGPINWCYNQYLRTRRTETRKVGNDFNSITAGRRRSSMGGRSFSMRRGPNTTTSTFEDFIGNSDTKDIPKTVVPFAEATGIPRRRSSMSKSLHDFPLSGEAQGGRNEGETLNRVDMLKLQHMAEQYGHSFGNESDDSGSNSDGKSSASGD